MAESTYVANWRGWHRNWRDGTLRELEDCVLSVECEQVRSRAPLSPWEPARALAHVGSEEGRKGGRAGSKNESSTFPRSALPSGSLKWALGRPRVAVQLCPLCSQVDAEQRPTAKGEGGEAEVQEARLGSAAFRASNQPLGSASCNRCRRKLWSFCRVCTGGNRPR